MSKILASVLQLTSSQQRSVFFQVHSRLCTKQHVKQRFLSSFSHVSIPEISHYCPCLSTASRSIKSSYNNNNYFEQVRRYSRRRDEKGMKDTTNALPTADEWKKWDKNELEKQLNPSSWHENEGMTPDQVFKKHEAFCKQETEKARKSLKHKLDVPYGTLPSQKMDIYGTDLDDEAPILFWIHGGYFKGGSKENSGSFAIAARHWGYKTIVFDHSLAPPASIDDIHHELILALGEAIKLNSKCSRFVIGGHEIGAQIAVSILSNNGDQALPQLLDRLCGFVLISGVFDLRPLVKSSLNTALKLTEVTALKSSPLFQTISPLWATAGVEVAIFESHFGSPELKSKSRMYYNQTRTMLQCYYWISSNDNHYSIIENLTVEISPIARRLQNYLEHLAYKGLLK